MAIMANPFVIIEPHADDALLSCSTTLYAKTDSPIEIATIHTSITSVRDELFVDNRGSEKLVDLCDNVVKTSHMRFPDYPWHARMASSAYRTYPIEDINRSYYKLCEEATGYSFDAMTLWMIELINSYLVNHSNPIFMVPLGMIHPSHVLTRGAFDRACTFISDTPEDIPVFYYKEFPYYCTKFGAKAYEATLDWLNLRVLDEFTVNKDRVRSDFEKSYPSAGPMLTNPRYFKAQFGDEIMGHKDVIYVRK